MDKHVKIEAIAGDSPLSLAQSAWIGGYFAGMQDAMASMAAATHAQQEPLFVLFGSQTGNAESFAQDLAEVANGECIDMADVQVQDFATYKNVVVVTSTYGDGEHPDNGQILWDAVQQLSTLKCHYAVIGLGDTAYDLFCKSAEDWDQYFEGRGAKRVLETVKLDVDFADFQDDIIAKTTHTFDALRGAIGGDLSGGGADVAVLFGSQTGNAEAFAADLGNALNAQVYDMADVEPEDLIEYKNIAIVTSTYGDGEHPDNGQILWDSVQNVKAVACNFVVIGLGDTAYDLFCQSAMDWEKFLIEKGGRKLLDTVTLDVDFADLQDDIIARTRDAFSISPTAKPTQKKSSSGHKSIYTRSNPYMGAFLTHTLLSTADSSKRVYHFEFEIDDPEMAYEAGDALGVIPINSDILVQNIIASGGFDGDKIIDGKPFYDILKVEREIRLPNRDFIALVAQNAQDSTLQTLLADKKAIDDWLWGRETVDILQQFNHKLTEDTFLSVMKPLQHRLYSISSSPKAHPGEVHLTVAAVEYDFNHRQCQGVASCFLAERLAIGDTVGLFIHANKAFSIPENGDTPIIMVGPGTGIAPFRAFLEQRFATNACGDNWLFFGDRTEANDFLYAETLTTWEKQGKLRLSLAWSRDPNTPKTYVQDLMLQQGEDIFKQLEKGAYFYICGDASRMAKDVDAALLEIVSTHGAMAIEKATAYINDLKKNKRYVRDVY